jgi:hypothetical protein
MNRCATFAIFAASFVCAHSAHADLAAPSPPPIAPAEPTHAAFGIDPSARLVVRAAPRPLPRSVPPPVLAARRVSPLRLAATEYLAGGVAAAITVPLTLALGTWLGSLSNDLVGAALPPLLLFTIVPAFAVTGAEVVAGNMLVPGVASIHPAIWPALATTIVSIAIGSVAGVSLRNAASFSVFSLVVSLVLPAGVTAVLHARRPRWAVAAQANNEPAAIAPRVFADMRRLEDPYAARTVSIPLFTGAF